MLNTYRFGAKSQIKVLLGSFFSPQKHPEDELSQTIWLRDSRETKANENVGNRVQG